MLSINTNVASLQAAKNLSNTQNAINRSIDHLSAGLRITSASDDAAGLADSMSLQAQIASYNAAAQNTQTGIANVQTAEGYLNEVGNILTRLRELTTNGQGSGTEGTALKGELDRIDNVVSFAGMGSVGATVGIDGTSNSTVTLSVSTWHVDSTTLDPSSLSKIDAAIQTVAGYRSNLGATANVLQDALGTLQTASTNVSAVNSSIMDVDVASETAKLSRNQVLAQAGISVLAQANQLPQMALKLLG